MSLFLAEPRIEKSIEKKLIGKRIRMSFSENRTYDLWHSFMPKRKLITNNLTSDLFSVQVYDELTDFNKYIPDTEFDKWAAMEVADFDKVPEEMESFILPEGLYAVFVHKGGAVKGVETFRYIYGTWLPASVYELDNRPHFEVLGEKYKNDDPDSEEEVWIPIKIKK